MGLCMCTKILDDDGELTASQSFARDVAVLKSRILARKMPVVWLLGDAQAVNTHAANVAERFNFACLDAAKIVKEESLKEHSRAKMIRNKNSQGKKVPDRIMVDLIKEQMISAGDTRGYLLAGFPLTTKQSQLFTKELTQVNCVILLQHFETHAQQDQQDKKPGVDMPEGDKGLGDKKQQKEKDKEKEKEKEEEQVREIVEAAGEKWDLILEKINAAEPTSDIFLKIEAAILDRTGTMKV